MSRCTHGETSLGDHNGGPHWETTLGDHARGRSVDRTVRVPRNATTQGGPHSGRTQWDYTGE
eukprot:11348052-Heterocapsa_arctica.AAC.1